MNFFDLKKAFKKTRMSEIKLDNILYYYSSDVPLSINGKNKNTQTNLIDKFYYSKDDTDIIKDKRLIKKLINEYRYLSKLRFLIASIEKNIINRKLKIARQRFPIGSKFICKTKYGGVLYLKVLSVSNRSGDIMIVENKHNHSYDISLCISIGEMRMKKFKNIMN